MRTSFRKKTCYKKNVQRRTKRYNKKHVTRRKKRSHKRRRLQYGGKFNQVERTILINRIKELFPEITDAEISAEVDKLDVVSQQFQGRGIEQIINQLNSESFPKTLVSLRKFIDDTVKTFTELAYTTDVEYDTEED